MGARRHHGPFARVEGAVRAPSRCVHPDVTPPSGYRIAARRACRPGRDSDRRDLHGTPLRPAYSQPGTLHAGPRNRYPTDGVVGGRLAAHGGREGCAVLRGGGAGAAAGPVLAGGTACPTSRTGGFRQAGTSPGLPVAALAVAGRTLQPDRTSRPPAALRPRNAGQPVFPSPGRPAAAVALLQRRYRDRLRAGSLPADGRPGLLLQRQQVSLPVDFARRGVGEAHSRHILPPRPASAGCLYGANCHPRRGAGASAGGGGLRAPLFRVPGGGAGLVLAARAVGCQHSVGRGRTSWKPEFHRRVCRHVLSGRGGDPPAGGFRLLRVPGAKLSGDYSMIACITAFSKSRCTDTTCVWIMTMVTIFSAGSIHACVPYAPSHPKLPVETRSPDATGSSTTPTSRPYPMPRAG